MGMEQEIYNKIQLLTTKYLSEEKMNNYHPLCSEDSVAVFLHKDRNTKFSEAEVNRTVYINNRVEDHDADLVLCRYYINTRTCIKMIENEDFAMQFLCTLAGNAKRCLTKNSMIKSSKILFTYARDQEDGSYMFRFSSIPRENFNK